MDAGVRRRFGKVIEASGLDLKAASQRAGFGDTYVRDVIVRDRGKLDNVLKIVEQIAPKYVLWVHQGSGEPPPETFEAAVEPTEAPSTFSAPVMGLIGAGAEINVGVEQVPPEGFYDIDTIVPLPPGVVVFEVVGDSMYPRYDPGDVIICHKDGIRTDQLRDGAEAAVLVDDGRRFLKKVRREGDGTFTLESHNASPIRGVHLTWVAPVMFMIPTDRWTKVTNGHRKPRLKAGA